MLTFSRSWQGHAIPDGASADDPSLNTPSTSELLKVVPNFLSSWVSMRNDAAAPSEAEAITAVLAR